jgi:hypothetical protein
MARAPQPKCSVVGLPDRVQPGRPFRKAFGNPCHMLSKIVLIKRMTENRLLALNAAIMPRLPNRNRLNISLDKIILSGPMNL